LWPIFLTNCFRTDQVRAQAAPGGGLTSLASVRACADTLLADGRFIGSVTAVADSDPSLRFCIAMVLAPSPDIGRKRVGYLAVDGRCHVKGLPQLGHRTAQPGQFEAVAALQIDRHR
jgi:hypothetical protein